MVKRFVRAAQAVIAALALVAATLSPALAQMPPDIAARVKALGRVIDPPKTALIYQPLHGDVPYAGVDVQRDVKYGPDARHLLDIVTPKQKDARARPVLVFVHGGGFLRGNRVTIGPFYSNVPVWAMKNGFIGVSMTYRLAPQHRWPAGRDDVSAAVEYLRTNVARHGGDPDRIHVMGHSAGAIHVGHYVAMLAEQNRKAIAGAILLSGLFSFDAAMAGPGEKQYFGENGPGYSEGTSLPKLAKAPFPLLVAHGELDPPLFVAQSQALNKTLCDAGKCPRFVPLKGHSHISESYAIGTADVSLTGEILSFAGLTK